MNESFEEACCTDCWDFYNKAAMNGNLCFSRSGENKYKENRIEYKD